MFDKFQTQIMASALASLTANYTDSEGEEDLSREEQEEPGDRLHPTLAERLGKLGDSPGSSGSAGSLARQSNSQTGEGHLIREKLNISTLGLNLYYPNS